MKLLFSILVLMCIWNYSAQAQTSVNAGGINAGGPGGSVAASVGQIVFQTESSPSYYLIQGVQQPYEVSVITSYGKYGGHVTLNIFPNPTTRGVTLSTDIADFQGWNYIVYDLNGKTMQKRSITSDECLISLEGNPTGTYYLKVFDQSTLVKAFKIVKM